MQGQSNCQNTEATSATPLYLYMETIFFYFTKDKTVHFCL